MIEIKKLFKSFGSNEVLKDINLTFQLGKINGIAGRNGAGKTTLFRCIAGLEDYGGKINFDDKAVKYKIGHLPADPYFMTRLTGKEYLQLVTRARGLYHSDYKNKNIFELPLDQYASTYSTGMKKKLALMGLLLQENDILLLDEPFNGVDIQSNVLITEIIKRLKSTAKTIVLSSHILGSLTELSDRIHILDDGVIAQTVQKNDFAILNQTMIDDDYEKKLNRLGL